MIYITNCWYQICVDDNNIVKNFDVLVDQVFSDNVVILLQLAHFLNVSFQLNVTLMYNDSQHHILIYD